MLLALHLLPRLRALPLVAGGLVAILGLAVLAGWLTGNAAWVQVQPDLAPVQGNSAVGFLLCGIALVGLYLGWRRLPELLGASVAVLAALTLSQYLLGIDLGIDQALFEHSITVHTSPPGRMAPNAAGPWRHARRSAISARRSRLAERSLQ